jgi:hypothetical protein
MKCLYLFPVVCGIVLAGLLACPADEKADKHGDKKLDSGEKSKCAAVRQLQLTGVFAHKARGVPLRFFLGTPDKAAPRLAQSSGRLPQKALQHGLDLARAQGFLQGRG